MLGASWVLHQNLLLNCVLYQGLRQKAALSASHKQTVPEVLKSRTVARSARVKGRAALAEGWRQLRVGSPGMCSAGHRLGKRKAKRCWITPTLPAPLRHSTHPMQPPWPWPSLSPENAWPRTAAALGPFALLPPFSEDNNAVMGGLQQLGSLGQMGILTASS